MVTVIVVSFNTREETLLCLQKVCGVTPSPEIIVVDNCSTDGTVSWIRREMPAVEVFELNVNLGFSKANNLAARKAKGEYLMFLNSDCFIASDTIGTLTGYLEMNQGVGIVGCRLLNADGTLQDSVWKRPCLKNDFLSLFGWREVSSSWRLHPDSCVEAEVLSGALLMVRRSCFEQISGFDENFFLYMEEMDLCWRARKRGWKVMYLPTTQAVHLGGVSQAKLSRNKVRLVAQSLSYFYRKHYGRVALGLLILMHLLSLPLRMCAHVLLLLVHRKSALAKLQRDTTMAVSLVRACSPGT